MKETHRESFDDSAYEYRECTMLTAKREYAAIRETTRPTERKLQIYSNSTDYIICIRLFYSCFIREENVAEICHLYVISVEVWSSVIRLQGIGDLFEVRAVFVCFIIVCLE